MAGWYTVPAPVHAVIRRLVPRGRLTLRDQKVLLALGRAGCLSLAELSQDCFRGDATYAAERLKKLQEWHLVIVRDDTWVLQSKGWLAVQALLSLEEEA
ncbi:MAG TPA: hypothetical protein VGK74_21495 [Symbiobacteriaceae bacterium]|jgi:predicted transcriptional regulator